MNSYPHRKTNHGGYWKGTRKKLISARRRTKITFLQCRRIIKLFIEGLSIAKIVDRTGLSRRMITQVLDVTREVLLRSGSPRELPVASLRP